MYPNNYYVSFPDGLLAKKLLSFAAYQDERKRTDALLTRQISQEIYGFSEGSSPDYYQGTHIDFNAYAATEEGVKAIAEMNRELRWCLKKLSAWAKAQALKALDAAGHPTLSVHEELFKFYKRLEEGAFSNRAALFYTDGKKSIETLALLVKEESIDLAFRQNQLISLAAEGNLQQCADGCFSRFMAAAESLKNYGDLSVTSLAKKFVRYLAEKAAISSKFGTSSYSEFLCSLLRLRIEDYEIHAQNYLINRLLSELDLESLAIKDGYTVTFENSKNARTAMVYKDFVMHFKKEFTASHFIQFIKDQYYQRENIQFIRGKFSSLETMDSQALENFLTELGQDDDFNLHEVLALDDDTGKVILKGENELSITLTERLINAGWLASDKERWLSKYDLLVKILEARAFKTERLKKYYQSPPAGIATDQNYKVVTGNLALTWLKNSEEERVLLLHCLEYIENCLVLLKEQLPGNLLKDLLENLDDLMKFFKALPDHDHLQALHWMRSNKFELSGVMMNERLFSELMGDLSARFFLVLMKDWNKLFSILDQGALSELVTQFNSDGLVDKLLAEGVQTVGRSFAMDKLFLPSLVDFIALIQSGGFSAFKNLEFKQAAKKINYLKNINFEGMNFEAVTFNTFITSVDFIKVKLDKVKIVGNVCKTLFTRSFGNIEINGNVESADFSGSELKMTIVGGVSDSIFSLLTGDITVKGKMQLTKGNHISGSFLLEGDADKVDLSYFSGKLVAHGDLTDIRLNHARGERIELNGKIQNCDLHALQFNEMTVNGVIHNSYLTGIDLREATFPKSNREFTASPKKVFNVEFLFDHANDERSFFEDSQFSTASLTEFLEHPSINDFTKKGESFHLLRGTDLREVDFQDTQLKKAFEKFDVLDLKRANLQSANFKYFLKSRNFFLLRKKFYKFNFENANLKGANFEGTSLEGANLKGANLSGCDLSLIDIKSANVRAAKIEGSRLRSDQLFQFYEQGHRDFSSVSLTGSLEKNLQMRLLSGIKLSSQAFNHLKNEKLINFQEIEMVEGEFNVGEECLYLRKKRSESHCLFTQEDVAEFNEGELNTSDRETIRINSQKFLSVIAKLPEEKRAQLIRFVSNKSILGPSELEVKQLVHEEKVQAYFGKLDRISSGIMHGLITKSVIRDFLAGHHQGVAVNFAMIGGGIIQGELATAAFVKGEQLSLLNKRWLGYSLKMSSPFLERGTSVFIIYSIMQQVQQKKILQGDEIDRDALVNIFGNTVYLSTDFVQIFIGVMRSAKMLSGSTAAGSIGSVVGVAVLFSTEIYRAARKVSEMNKILPLTDGEKFIEGLQAFLGIEPQAYLGELINRKQVNNQLVTQGLKYLKQQPLIQRYVFPTGTMVKDCPKITDINTAIKHTACSWFMTIISFGRDRGTCDERIPLQSDYPSGCSRSRYQTDLNNTINLDKKRPKSIPLYRRRKKPNTNLDINWSRVKPDNFTSAEGELFCHPRGEEESATTALYECEAAIGIADVTPKAGNYTLIAIGSGRDIVRGFLDSPNIIHTGNGFKALYGGMREDMFILQGDSITGMLDGREGDNTVDVGSFVAKQNWLQINLDRNSLDYRYGERDETLRLFNFSQILARKDKADNITCACSTRYVDGRGGKDNNYFDTIWIPPNPCFYNLQIVLHPNTRVVNQAQAGNFSYQATQTGNNGEAFIDLNALEQASQHEFIFNYTLFDVDNIQVKPVNNTSQSASFHFIIPVSSVRNTSSNRFNVTILSPVTSNTSYSLNDGTAINIESQNIYVRQKSSYRLATDIIQKYAALARKLQAFITIQGKDETLRIGHEENDILPNDPAIQKSHLVGNGGENVYVISTQESIAQKVVLYRYYTQNGMTDTLDLRPLAQQYESHSGIKPRLHIARPSKASPNDLRLTLAEVFPAGSEPDRGSQRFFHIILKDANIVRWKWYRELRVIYNLAPLRIEQRGYHHWVLVAEPLRFDQFMKTIFIFPEDVEWNTLVIIDRKVGLLTFLRSGADLVIITNVDQHTQPEDFFTLVLKRFYQEIKLSTLSIQFIGSPPLKLAKERERLKHVPTLAEWLNQRKAAVNQAVFSEVATTSANLAVVVFSKTEREDHQPKVRRDIQVVVPRGRAAYSEQTEEIATASTHWGMLAGLGVFGLLGYLYAKLIGRQLALPNVAVPALLAGLMPVSNAEISEEVVACQDKFFNEGQCVKHPTSMGILVTCANSKRVLAFFKGRKGYNSFYVADSRRASFGLDSSGENNFILRGKGYCQQVVDFKDINEIPIDKMVALPIFQEMLKKVEPHRRNMAFEQYSQQAKEIVLLQLTELFFIFTFLGDLFRAIGLTPNWQQRDPAHWLNRILRSYFIFTRYLFSKEAIAAILLETALLHPRVQSGLPQDIYRSKLAIRFIADLLQFGPSASSSIPVLCDFLLYQHPAWSYEKAMGLRAAFAMLEVVRDPSTWYLTVGLFILPQVPCCLEGLGIPVTRCISYALKMLEKFFLPFSLLLSLEEDPQRLEEKEKRLQLGDLRCGAFFRKASKAETNDAEFPPSRPARLSLL